jgi:hypothetical protein
LPKLDLNILKHIYLLVVERLRVIISMTDIREIIPSWVVCTNLDHTFPALNREPKNRNFMLAGYYLKPSSIAQIIARLNQSRPSDTASKISTIGTRLITGKINEESNYYTCIGQTDPYRIARKW